jgi:phosphatidylserine/phosphatidylglycerophosphate/cardiolipin synthase-like enzyme
VLTDSAVIEALRAASARGAKVRVWRDASEAARLSEYDVKAQLGSRVQGLELLSSTPGGELMHLKGYCVDHRLLRTGSANFSQSGERRQDNDLIALRGARGLQPRSRETFSRLLQRLRRKRLALGWAGQSVSQQATTVA